MCQQFNQVAEQPMDTKTGFSLQVELIRQIQSDNGQEACYATPATVGCTKKQNECSWRHDCFQDAEELDGGWHEMDAAASGEGWSQTLD